MYSTKAFDQWLSFDPDEYPITAKVIRIQEKIEKQIFNGRLKLLLAQIHECNISECGFFSCENGEIHFHVRGHNRSSSYLFAGYRKLNLLNFCKFYVFYFSS